MASWPPPRMLLCCLTLLYCGQLPGVRADRATKGPEFFKFNRRGIAPVHNSAAFLVNCEIQEVGPESGRKIIDAALGPCFGYVALTERDIVHSVLVTTRTQVRQLAFPGLHELGSAKSPERSGVLAIPCTLD